jgi:hypothetical protein
MVRGRPNDQGITLPCCSVASLVPKLCLGTRLAKLRFAEALATARSLLRREAELPRLRSQAELGNEMASSSTEHPPAVFPLHWTFLVLHWTLTLVGSDLAVTRLMRPWDFPSSQTRYLRTLASSTSTPRPGPSGTVMQPLSIRCSGAIMSSSNP